MTSAERLQSVQDQLIERGVVDVKLTFAPGALQSCTLEELMDATSDMLDCYLTGNFKEREFDELF